MKPKISIISTLPPTKGLSPYTLGLVKELSKKANIEFYGFKSIYPEFMYPGGTKTNESEPKIKNVNIHNYLSWYNPFSWINVGFKINTPIVHAQWWSWFLAPVYYTVLKIARMRDKKIIMTIHNVKPHEKSFIKDFLNNSVIGLADEYIVHSEENKRQFLELNNTKKKIYVIPHGIIEFAKSNLSKEQLLKKYNFTKQDKIILFFGNIRPYKGLDVLIKSLPNISNKNVKLIIAGKPWGSFEEYQKIIDELNLKDKITLFLDFNTQEKIAELFKISDLAAFPYKEFEASSGAAATALFYEKPIVVTNVGGLTELVSSQAIAQANNPLSLAQKIDSALKNLNKLNKTTKSKKKEFAWNKLADKTIEVYEK